MNRRAPRGAAGRRGATITELMVATALLSVGILAFFSAFSYISRSIFISRAQTLATNLAQERVEALKNINYYGLLITTAAATNTNFSPSFQYDTSNYPPETISIGGINFTRYTFVSLGQIDDHEITQASFDYPDTGMKQIAVHIVWRDGANWKKWSLHNLLENPNVNPLDATIAGSVAMSGGGAVAGAEVRTEQNPDLGGTADASGNYSFKVYSGTYTVRASSAGFRDSVSTQTVVARGVTKTVNLVLTKYATGTVSGIAWYNSDLVISQVVAATFTAVGGNDEREVEYVELFNPTTYPIDIGRTSETIKAMMMFTSNEDGLYQYDFGTGYFGMVNITTYVPPLHYYLYANATWFMINGTWVRADAYYDQTLTYPDHIKNDKAATIYLYDWSPGYYMDILGWPDNNNAPPSYESNYPPNPVTSDGLGSPLGQQLVRVSSPGASAAVTNAYGRAYDSNNNRLNFVYNDTILHNPRSTFNGGYNIVAGKPATNAYISAADPNSQSTMTYTAYITSATYSLPYSRFELVGVATGTWEITAAMSTYYTFVNNVSVSQGVTTSVPGAATSPAYLAAGLHHVHLSSSATIGFVRGTISDIYGSALSGVSVDGGITSKTTGSNGLYFITSTTGTVTIVVNANNASAPGYAQEIASVEVSQGVVSTRNFSLSRAGKITGYATTGTTPLANIVFTATTGSGSQAGAGTTNGSGMFTISNISTGTYTVKPVLESGQDASPNETATTLSSTGTIHVGTFTISGAFGAIAGTVSDAAGLITSGALIVASTNSIASTPPSIVGSSAPALTPYYMASSKADGTYTLPVRGGSTYYLSVYVPVISGAGVSVTTKTYSNISVSASATQTQNVTIP